jgi:hypothetical protein
MSFSSDWSDGKKWTMGIVGALTVGVIFAGAGRVATWLTPDTEPWLDSAQWQVDANDGRFGWANVADPKSDHRPATMERRGILVLHPVGRPDNPAVVKYRGALGPKVATLTIQVSGATAGDCEIRVYGGGAQLTASSGSPRSEPGNVIDGRRWYSFTFDVGHLSRSNPNLEFHVYGGGSNDWWYETAFVDSISLS